MTCEREDLMDAEDFPPDVSSALNDAGQFAALLSIISVVYDLISELCHVEVGDERLLICCEHHKLRTHLNARNVHPNYLCIELTRILYHRQGVPKADKIGDKAYEQRTL